jgi:hypothetical protein
MEKDFNKLVLETLALQLVRGYTITDSQGYSREVNSPLQVIVSKWVGDNNKLIIEQVANILGSSEIKKAIKEIINENLKSEWTVKSYQKAFVNHFKEVVEEEVVKDLRVLLKDKKVSIILED